MNTTTKKILSLTFLITILSIPVFVNSAINPYELDNISEIQNTGLSKRSIYNITSALMNWSLGIITFLAVISFVISGIYFITAGANSQRAETAKDWLIYSIIGIVVALIGYIVINLIDNLIKANNTLPSS